MVDNYPTSQYVEDAQAKIRFARDQLAGKEMQVGRYYLERKEYLAAVSRFRTWSSSIPIPTRSKKHWPVWSKPTTHMGLTIRSADRCRRSRTQLSGQPVV